MIVVCGEPQFEDDNEDVLLNLTLLVEIMSPSTEHHDRGRKFQDYRSIESFVEYLLVDEDGCWIEQFTKLEDGSWLLTNITVPEAAVVELLSIPCQLALREIYDKVPL